jgi:hypothetical protein
MPSLFRRPLWHEFLKGQRQLELPSAESPACGRLICELCELLWVRGKGAVVRDGKH